MQHSLGPDEGLKEKEAGRFAHDLAHHLRAGREQGRFRRLYVVAPPHFLGVLRQHVDEHTLALVIESFDKDLVRHGAEDIRKHLPERL
jgi:protein required for attachment to host cells